MVMMVGSHWLWSNVVLISKEKLICVARRISSTVGFVGVLAIVLMCCMRPAVVDGCANICCNPDDFLLVMRVMTSCGALSKSDVSVALHLPAPWLVCSSAFFGETKMAASHVSAMRRKADAFSKSAIFVVLSCSSCVVPTTA